MVARNIERHHAKAEAAIAKWKQDWKIATFGTDEEYRKTSNASAEAAEALIKDFGPQLIVMGKKIWQIQKDALKEAPFIKNAKGSGKSGASTDKVPCGLGGEAQGRKAE